MDLDILDVTIFDGHALRPENRVSIRDGLISEIGTGTAETPAARTITATGRLLTPGFVDAHVHTTFGGQESLACDLSQADGLDEALDTVRLHLGRTEGWVTGGGWSMADFPGGAPTANILDEVTANRPTILLSADHHSAWVNQAAMSLAGIDATTPDPRGGVIVRDESGEPTGCLHEAAIDLVGAHVPPANDAAIRAGLRAGQSYLHRLGVTAWMDAIIGDYSGHRSPFEAYVAAEETGELTAEVVGSLWWPRDVVDIDAEVDRLLTLRRAAGGFRTTSVKFMLDGIVESRTAAMNREYSCPCGGFGTSYFTREHLEASFAALDAAGFDLHCHAIGDAAVKAALDAFDAIGSAPGTAATGGSTGRRHHIAHVQVVDPGDVPPLLEAGGHRESAGAVGLPRPADDRPQHPVPRARAHRLALPLRLLLPGGHASGDGLGLAGVDGEPVGGDPRRPQPLAPLGRGPGTAAARGSTRPQHRPARLHLGLGAPSAFGDQRPHPHRGTGEPRPGRCESLRPRPDRDRHRDQ